MCTLVRVSIQISKEQKNAVKELKSSGTVVLRGHLVALVYANPEGGAAPTPSTGGFYPGGTSSKAVTQFNGTESKSHPKFSASAPGAC